MRLGFIYGILAAVSIVIPLLLVDYLAIIPGLLVFMCGGAFAISARMFARGEKG